MVEHKSASSVETLRINNLSSCGFEENRYLYKQTKCSMFNIAFLFKYIRIKYLIKTYTLIKLLLISSISSIMCISFCNCTASLIR